MAGFVPKKFRQTREYPECVDLQELFESEKYRLVLENVFSILLPVYQGFSDSSFERISRPSTVTEVFDVTMPTVAAYEAEIALCNAIRDRSLEQCAEFDLKRTLQRYLDTHIRIFEGTNQRLKSGESPRTGPEVPIYELFVIPRTLGARNFILNAIQAWFVLRLEKLNGNNAEYEITKL